ESSPTIGYRPHGEPELRGSGYFGYSLSFYGKIIGNHLLYFREYTGRRSYRLKTPECRTCCKISRQIFIFTKITRIAAQIPFFPTVPQSVAGYGRRCQFKWRFIGNSIGSTKGRNSRNRDTG